MTANLHRVKASSVTFALRENEGEYVGGLVGWSIVGQGEVGTAPRVVLDEFGVQTTED